MNLERAKWCYKMWTNFANWGSLKEHDNKIGFNDSCEIMTILAKAIEKESGMKFGKWLDLKMPNRHERGRDFIKWLEKKELEGGVSE